MIKRHLTAKIHQSNGSFDRRVLLAMIEKMSDQEAQALYHLLRSKDEESARNKRLSMRPY